MSKKMIIKYSYLLLIVLFSSYLFACNKSEQYSDFQLLVNNIYNSEQIIAGYNQTNIIMDNDIEVYNKNTTFNIQRGDKIISNVVITEKKLSSSGISEYEEKITSYKTVDNIKYTEESGNIYQNEFEMPTYYLTFVLSEEFLEEGYQLTRSDDDYILSGKVYDNKIGSLFLNKSLKDAKDLYIEIVVKDNKLQSFNCNYQSETGFITTIETIYYYGYIGQVAAVFNLEGGTCRNSQSPISYLYDFDGSILERQIVDPNVLETDLKNQIVRGGYFIEGWYKTKIENADGTITYEDKWDFKNDKMDSNGVVLYARWLENVYHKYELHYINENGEDVILDSLQVNEGDKFKLNLVDNNTVENYTVIGLLDEYGNPWDDNFVHPGGETDTIVKVYLDLIEGEYSLVDTYTEFRNAITKNENIYLLKDIDCRAKKITFNSYSGIIEGNNYKIYNFEVKYDPKNDGLKGELDDINGITRECLYISLFFELKDVTINNLTFEEMLIEVDTSNTRTKKIFVAPLAIISEHVKLNNFHLSGEIIITEIPEGCDITIINDKYSYTNNELMENIDSTINVTVK